MPGLGTASPPRPIVVTGADQAFWRALAQFLLSAERHRVQTRYDWVVYDLGLHPGRLAWLQRRFDWAEWRRVPFEDLPPHYDPKTRSFAWKPWVVRQVLDKAQAPVLWLDSATILKRDLDEIFDWTRRHSVFAAHGQDAMRDRCEPSVMDALGFPRGMADLRELVANVVAFDPCNPVALKAARDWERHARQADLLLPAEITAEKHMNDQAVLSCLLLPLDAAGEIRLPNVDADICAGRPYRMISTRNKLPPWLPIWADPFARLWYWTYKTVDQALWRRKTRKAKP